MFYLTNPVFHEIAYGIQVFTIVVENIYLIRKLKLSPRLYIISFGYYLTGFLLCNIDNNMCNYLKAYRSKINGYIKIVDDTFGTRLFFGPIIAKILNSILIFLKSFSEFHSIWHLLTGYGAYLTILFLLNAYYEHQLVKRFKRLESTESFQNLENAAKEKLKSQSSHKRPVVGKFFNFAYDLNHSYIKNDKKSNKKH